MGGKGRQMSGQTSFYVERQKPNGTWELILEDGEPAYLAEWGNRSFDQWVLRGLHRDEVGEPPPALCGLPVDASTGIRAMEAQGHFEYESIGWMWLSDLVNHPAELLCEWKELALTPGLRRLGLENEAGLRLIFSTD